MDNETTEQNTQQVTEGKLDLESTDLSNVRLALLIMIKAQKAGPKSRARSLVITKLEEARLWAGEALFAED